MDKTFDDLFNDFLKNNKPKKNQNQSRIKNEDSPNEELRNDIKNIIDMVTNLSGAIDEEQIDSKLGKPDKIEHYNEGNVFFEKRTWYMEQGELVKIVITDDPTLNLQPKTKTLQEELDEALAEEKYEKAAEIRDRMNKKHKKLGEPIKENVKKRKTKK